MTLMFCSRSPAVDKYLHKETKEKCVYSSFYNPQRECGTAGALVLHPFIFCFSTAGVRDRRSTSSTLTYYSFFSTFIYIIILTAGLREQAINNLLLTEREGRTGEYWPEVVAVRTERSEVRTKTIEGQYSPVRLELARLVSSLLYGTRTMLVLNLPAFENKKKYTAYDRFHGNGPYGEIPTEKEPIGTLGFVLPYNNVTQSWRGILKLLLKRISFP